MSIQGLNNNSSLFNLNNIRSLATTSSSTSSGGAFNLGSNDGTQGSIGQGSQGSLDTIGSGDLGLGNVNNSDPNTKSAIDSVAGESALQDQFKNQLSLINLQDRIQTQSRTVEILTNILKSRHDAALSAARNVK